jgi:hypothetical protein
VRTAKNLLCVFLVGACACAGAVATASAQVPFVQVLFDGATATPECKEAATFDTLDVVAYNLNMWLLAFDLAVQYPPALLFIEDLIDATLWLGVSFDGLAIVWQTPRDAFQPVELFRVHVVWTGACDCTYGVQPVYVNGWPGKPNPSAVRWPDYVESDVLGLSSLICATPPAVHASSWGRIKALYR